MNNFKEYLKSKDLSKNTVEHYHMHLLEFISYLDKDNTEIEQATEKEILGYLQHLQKQGLSNDTRKLRLYSLQHFFNYQIDHKKKNRKSSEKNKNNRLAETETLSHTCKRRIAQFISGV